MSPLKAVVRNGRIVVDEPVDLPEGTVVELVPVRDDTDEERARRDASLQRAWEQLEAGQGIPAEKFLDKLGSP